MEYIAYVETPYKEKFGIPRQSGLAESTCGETVSYTHLRAHET
mgnify:CR=1 FL=1